jgi:ABC-2 type transport system permease protein
MMTRIREFLVMTAAFAVKELVSVLRQPRLVATLILGPFLILALFGLGYRQDPPAITAMLVVESDSPRLKQQMEENLTRYGDSIEVDSIVDDTSVAVAAVRSGQVDVAVVAPENPVETVRAGEHPLVEVLHDVIDPVQTATIRLVARATIDSVNRALLADAIEVGQQESEDVAPVVAQAVETATALRVAAEAGDEALVNVERSRLARQLDVVDSIIGPTNSLGRSLGADLGDEPVGERIDTLQSRLTDDDGDLDGDAQVEAAREIESEVEDIEQLLADFTSIDSEVIVSPLDVETALVGSVSLDATDFYAAGVIALLLQHLAITFGALSLVRERALGTIEVFQVAPVGPSNILLGKYLGYTLGAAAIGGLLSLLTIIVFGVPLAGPVWQFAAVQVLLIVASLGVGFLISNSVETDTQAVNAAMIFLLLSIFFSGFFLTLDRLVPAVRAVSWALPITHALDSMRDIMFRNTGVDLRSWLALGGGSVALFAASFHMLRRRLHIA